MSADTAAIVRHVINRRLRSPVEASNHREIPN
jgi:hypothetical protein